LTSGAPGPVARLRTRTVGLQSSPGIRSPRSVCPTRVPATSSKPRRSAAMAPAARFSYRLRIQWSAGHSAGRAVRSRGKRSGGRAYASARRFVNGNAELELPRLEVGPY
jgi:hypothetical protein